jgi:serine/threonine protein kinase
MASVPEGDSAPAAPVQPGDLLAGKYRVQAILGQGAMGVVVAAVHEHLNQKVALKFLLPDALKSEDAVARFTREARAMVKIQSEHIARVIDVGALESGAPYTVMEFLQGRDLCAVLEDSGPLTTELAVDYVLQACEAIAEAHAAGIIHRDLKPANLFLTTRTDGSSLVKVLDFGIAKSLDDLTMNGAQTNAGTLLGSPYYMSPEQMRSSHNVDRRSDIWALGVILFELLTGRPVFVSDTMPGLCGAILSDPPTRLRELRSSAPEGLEAAILRCLERDLDARFQNIAEFARAIFPYAKKSSRVSVERISRLLGESMQPESIPAPPPSEVAAPGARTGGPWAETQHAPAPKRRRGLVGLAVGGAICAAVLVAIVARKPPTDAAPKPEAAARAVAPVPAAVPPPAPSAIPETMPEVVPALASAAAAPTSPPTNAPAAAKARQAAHGKPPAKGTPAVKSTSGGAVDPLDGRK